MSLGFGVGLTEGELPCGEFRQLLLFDALEPAALKAQRRVYSFKGLGFRV